MDINRHGIISERVDYVASHKISYSKHVAFMQTFILQEETNYGILTKYFSLVTLKTGIFDNASKHAGQIKMSPA